MNHLLRTLRGALLAGASLALFLLPLAAGNMSLEEAETLRTDAGLAREALGRALPVGPESEMGVATPGSSAGPARGFILLGARGAAVLPSTVPEPRCRLASPVSRTSPTPP